ncbi:Protein kinase domain-containing protein [Mycena indigotica]|uniref:Protein kinase domain-containing protein n=1 Tax=Mycena indigotica TaxID=2126181 RepID=A0A8H6WEA2_9AGAR|nr:Protein kinase domain-containing protein [Mycena indigotica]KAF7315509.1 Protein kinase domain-containing protein [Mycena indigotica]
MSAPQCHPGLFETEKEWVEHQPFLLQQGYLLRPRYNPQWLSLHKNTSKWKRWGLFTSAKSTREDDVRTFVYTAMDATRVSDNKKVVLKRFLTTNSREVTIHRYLDSPQLRVDPRNHTIPLLDVIVMPDTPWSFLVTPYSREIDYPPFHCRLEFVECMTQFIEGLEFMHEHNIAHLDIARKNMLMDESRVVPQGSHFGDYRSHTGIPGVFRWRDRCSVGPVPYYYIDFGLSHHFPNGKDTASVKGKLRTFPDIPELSDDVPYNPFPVDIYQLGLTIHKIIYCYPDLEIFRPVADGMTVADPTLRTSPTQALACLRGITEAIPPQQLREQIWDTAATPKLKRDRKKLGGYRFDWSYIRDDALYGVNQWELPSSTFMKKREESLGSAEYFKDVQ